MPMYTVACGVCGAEQTVFRHVKEHGDWPECCGALMRQVVRPSHIVRDIQPYKAVAVDVATGKAPVIGGRAQHREYLRRNGYVEVGNEPVRPAGLPADKLDSPKSDIAHAFKQATGRL